MKTIAKSRLRTKEDMEGVRTEIAVQRHLTGSSAVVGIHEYFEDRANFVLVMDVMRGGELFDRIIRQHHFSERDAARVVRCMLRAVAHCHSMFVAHRDIKPENFLFETDAEDSNLRLIDFGLSSFFTSDDSRFRDVVGTAYYLAPEVIKGRAGPEADIWSVGVVTYTLLCGRPPFNGPDDQAIYDSILAFDPSVFEQYKFRKPPWPDVSAAAKSCVMRMLCRNPADRPSALEMLADPWVSGDDAPTKPLGSELNRRMKTFAKSTRFRKMALRTMAEQLNAEEIEGMRRVFERFDKNNDGVISLEELQAGLVEAAGEVQQPAGAVSGSADGGDLSADVLLAGVDLDGTGEISYEEFLASTLRLNKVTQEAALVAAFDSLDIDHDGVLSRDDLAQGIRDQKNFAAVRSFADSEDAVEDLLDSADTDGDGCISFDEFVSAVRAGDSSMPATPRTPGAVLPLRVRQLSR